MQNNGNVVHYIWKYLLVHMYHFASYAQLLISDQCLTGKGLEESSEGHLVRRVLPWYMLLSLGSASCTLMLPEWAWVSQPNSPQLDSSFQRGVQEAPSLSELKRLTFISEYSAFKMKVKTAIKQAACEPAVHLKINSLYTCVLRQMLLPHSVNKLQTISHQKSITRVSVSL